MDQVVPWQSLITLIELHLPHGDGGRPAYALMAMLRLHLMQNWFCISDPTMEVTLCETAILCSFRGCTLIGFPMKLRSSTSGAFWKKHGLARGILQVINGFLGDRDLMLCQGTVLDATIIHAPSLTKNKDDKRALEMHQTKKGSMYYLGRKAHIGVDAKAGLVHSVVGTASNVADVT